jgi:outer membrane protein OmpA-like peptidoglycan-associated protein
MSFNITDLVKGYLSKELLGKAASFLGESEDATTKAVGGLVPSVLSGLLSKATGSGAGADEVAKLASEAHSSGVLGSLAGFFGNDDAGGSLLSKGAGLVSGLMGNKLGGIAELVAKFAGVKSSSATSLLSMAAPLVLGSLGKHAADNNLNAGGLTSLLSSQKSNILSALPAGLGNLLGVGDSVKEAASHLTGAASNLGHKAAAATTEVAETSGSALKWLLPVLLLGGVAAGAYYFMNKDKGTETAEAKVEEVVNTTETAATTVSTDTAAKVESAVVSSVVESVKVKLADGVELSANKGGIEDVLVKFVEDKATAVDTANGNWFDFDNLNFKTGSADITAESQVQIKNIAAILKAYPSLKLKVGGYTDKVGNEASNVKLSQARADATLKAIVAAGGNAAQVVSAVGYGSKFAKFEASASDADRKKDRHISVNVKAK